MNHRQSLFPILFILAVIAIFILFLTLVFYSNANYGGLIMIGPIPIAFGSSAEMTAVAMIIGLLLVIVNLLFFIWSQRRMKEEHEAEARKPGEAAQSTEARPKTEIKGGGVIMIGPIPIIFGSDSKYASLAIVLAIILMILALLLMLAR